MDPQAGKPLSFLFEINSIQNRESTVYVIAYVQYMFFQIMKIEIIIFILQFCFDIYICCLFLDATVYCGNVDEKVEEALLWELFLQAGPVGKSTKHLPSIRKLDNSLRFTTLK